MHLVRSTSPQHPDDVVAELPEATVADVVAAAALVVREVGKPAGEASGEIARGVAILEYYAQAAYAPLGVNLPPALPGLLYTERRPHGVAGLITPWNFPVAIPL